MEIEEAKKAGFLKDLSPVAVVVEPKPPKMIIENTDEAQAEFGYGYSAESIKLTIEDIEALKAGKCIAIEIMDEYSAFITMEGSG